MVKIVPRYKLILRYDIQRESYDEYHHFVTGEMVPALQGLGLYMYRVYHTAYGDQPIRQVEFLSEELETVQRALNSTAWQRLEEKLLGLVSDYTRKTVRFREGFQL